MRPLDSFSTFFIQPSCMSSQTLDCGAMKVENLRTTSCAEAAPADIATAAAVATPTAHRVIAIHFSIDKRTRGIRNPAREFQRDYNGTSAGSGGKSLLL